MIKTFKRKPNNLKSFRLFVYISVPLIAIVITIIAIFSIEDIRSIDISLLLGLIFIFALWVFIIIVGTKQIRAKIAYMELTEPVLILSKTHLIYTVDDVEKYVIPRDSILDVSKDIIMEKYKDKVGVVRITCKEKAKEQIKLIKKQRYYNDFNYELDIVIAFFEISFDELYEEIHGFFLRSKGD
jgi:hypothetical protein